MPAKIPGFPNISSSIFDGMKIEPKISPMKKGTSKSWLANFYWVSLPVTDANKHDDIVTPAIEWCREQFGSSGSRWFEKDKKFFFKDEKDMTMFILKWS